MKTTRSSLKIAAFAGSMALFLGAAAAAGIDRGKDMSASGFTVNADVAAASTDADRVPVRSR